MVGVYTGGRAESRGGRRRSNCLSTTLHRENKHHAKDQGAETP